MTIDESEIERRKSVDINILLVLQDFRNGVGTFVSCFLQMFYVSFVFPWLFKHLEKA